MRGRCYFLKDWLLYQLNARQFILTTFTVQPVFIWSYLCIGRLISNLITRERKMLFFERLIIVERLYQLNARKFFLTTFTVQPVFIWIYYSEVTCVVHWEIDFKLDNTWEEDAIFWKMRSPLDEGYTCVSR